VDLARRGRRLGIAAIIVIAAVGFALLSVFQYRQAAYVERMSLRSNAALALSRGDSAAAGGDLDTALRQYSAAVDGLTTYQLSGGTSDPAAAAVTEAALADAFLKRGRIHDRNGDLAGAIADYGRAVSSQPGNAEAYLARGLSRSRAGDAAAALSDFSKVLELSSDPSLKATAYFYIGTAHEKAGRADEAVAAYTDAIGLRKDYTDAYFNRALVHEAARRKSAAIDDFEAVVRLSADPKSVEAARARLAALVPRRKAEPTPAPPRGKGLQVYVVFADAQDGQAALRLGQILWNRGVDARHVVPASQASTGKADQAFLAYSEVRYFARSDQERASEVAGLAESGLASLGYRVSLSPVLRASSAFPKASLEVWLPRLSPPPRSVR
jgi:tetratricopeptide (TPR) repeat protein